MSKLKKSSKEAVADPSEATAVAEPVMDATQTRIIEILRARGRMDVREVAHEAGLDEDTVRPILFTDLAALIEVVQSSENEDEDEDEGEPRRQEVYLRLTSAEADRRLVLEVDIESGLRKAAVAHREIHQNRLYRDYGSYEDYCENRWHHSRQWGYELMRWLQVTEALEAAGLTDVRLGIGDATELYRIRENPTEYASALAEAEQQAREEGVPRTREHLHKAVEARQGFVNLAKQVSDVTWEEFQALRSIPACDRTYTPFISVEHCVTAKQIPMDSYLLKEHRGQALLDLIEQLKPAATAIAELEALEAERQSVDKEAMDERKEIQKRITEVKRNVTAPPAKTAGAPQANGVPGPATDASGPATDASGQTPHVANDNIIAGLYDVVYDGDFLDVIGELPKPGGIIEDVFDFLTKLDTLSRCGKVSGEWNVVIWPHKREEDSSKGNTDKPTDNKPTDNKPQDDK